MRSSAGAGWHRLTERPNSIRNHPEFAFVPHDRGAGPSVRLVEAVQTGSVDPYAGRRTPRSRWSGFAVRWQERSISSSAFTTRLTMSAVVSSRSRGREEKTGTG